MKDVFGYPKFFFIHILFFDVMGIVFGGPVQILC
jgi:hypothetical protein